MKNPIPFLILFFYASYGNGRKDGICHAVSGDGLHFTRNPSNPVFHPTGEWTSGRAIDPEVFPMGDQLLLYFATRDPEMKIQMRGVAGDPQQVGVAVSRAGLKWKRLSTEPFLRRELAATDYAWDGRASIVEGQTQIGWLPQGGAGRSNNELYAKVSQPSLNPNSKLP